jgi:ABC-type glycerol-3-phosphate transport system substrate-binding protein
MKVRLAMLLVVATASAACTAAPSKSTSSPTPTQEPVPDPVVKVHYTYFGDEKFAQFVAKLRIRRNVPGLE